MNQSTAKTGSLPLKVRTAVGLFAACGALTLAWTLMSQSVTSPVRFLLLLVLAVGTANKKFRLYKDSSISFLTSVVLLSLMVAGPVDAILIAICGVAVQTYFPSRKLVMHRLLFNAGMIAVTVKATCWTYTFCTALTPEGPLNQLIAALAAASVYYLGNSLSVSLMVALSTGKGMWRMWLDHFAPSAPSFLVAGLLSLLASQVTMKLPEATMLVAIIPVVICCYNYTLQFVETRR